jgi:hypothetical protein
VGIIVNGPSVGFHLKNKADVYSAEYVDSLNFSVDNTYSFLSMDSIMGGSKY